MKIGLFGLSANPPTGEHGHRGIVKYLIGLDIFDEIWILPVYNHFFAKALIPFEYRMEMCRLNFGDLDKVRVLPIEELVCRNLGEGVRPGTIDTVEHILTHYGDDSLSITLILGKDTYFDLINSKWKQSERLLLMVDLAVFDRHGHPDLVVPDPLTSRVHVYKMDSSNTAGTSENWDVSSTNARRRLASGEEPSADEVYPVVLEYIHCNHLFESAAV